MEPSESTMDWPTGVRQSQEVTLPKASVEVEAGMGAADFWNPLWPSMMTMAGVTCGLLPPRTSPFWQVPFWGGGGGQAPGVEEVICADQLEPPWGLMSLRMSGMELMLSQAVATIMPPKPSGTESPA